MGEEHQELAQVDVCIVGSGFSGIGMAIRLKELGIANFVLLEKASEVGGTWRDNSYPGAACDVQSHLYSFSFAPNPNWSHSYSGQAEIQDYLISVTHRYGLREHCRFNTEVSHASWDEATQQWLVITPSGPLQARVLVWATGPLSQSKMPAIEGLERFQGLSVHTAGWGTGQDIAGKRVAVIGTGASAIQLIPAIAEEVKELTVFQRTPCWVVPRDDKEVPAWKKALYRALPLALKARRFRIYAFQELLAPGLLGRKSRFFALLGKLAVKQLNEQVTDEDLRAKLQPPFPIGCKRVLVSNSYYPSLQRDNVELIDAAAQSLTAKGVIDARGQEHEVDVVIFATGFEAANPAFAKDLVGRGGRLLCERWKTGMEAYLGSSVPEFPNLFFLAGPNTILGHNSVVYMIEAQLNQVGGAIQFLFSKDLGSLEVLEKVEQAWSKELAERFKGTVWTQGGCTSWYLNEQGKNTTLWPGYTLDFHRRTKHFHPGDYVVSPKTSAELSRN